LDGSKRSGEVAINTVRLGLSSSKGVRQRMAAPFQGRKQDARISFASEEVLWRTLDIGPRRPEGSQHRSGAGERRGDRVSCTPQRLSNGRTDRGGRYPYRTLRNRIVRSGGG
jgi:hypothetical protein